MNLNIRNLQIEDLEHIEIMELSIFGETITDLIVKEIDNPHLFFQILELNNQVIGYIGSIFIDEVMELLNFVINTNFQRKGYGQLLFDHYINLAKKRGLKEITLEVRQTNQVAIMFYQKNGFTSIGRRKAYYQNGEDAIIMKKEYI